MTAVDREYSVRVKCADLNRPDWLTETAREASKFRLDKNENTDPQLAAIISAIIGELAPSVFSSYPDLGHLYRKLSEWTEVPAKSLRVAAGSDGIIHSVFEAFISVGDRVIIPEPTFSMYSVYCKMFGAQVVGVQYLASPYGPQMKVSRLCQAIQMAQPKLVCLPNPGSPTGTVFREEDIKYIVGLCEQIGAIVIIDEAYHPFVDATAIKETNRYSNLIVARSAGKAWGMAGFRIGFSASSPQINASLHKVRPMYEIGSVSAAVFARMLDYESEMLASVRRLEEGRKYFVSEAKKLGFFLPKTYGNFQLVKFGAAEDQVHQLLSNVAYYRKSFDEPCLRGYSRISLASRETMEFIMRELRDGLREE